MASRDARGPRFSERDQTKTLTKVLGGIHMLLGLLQLLAGLVLLVMTLALGGSFVAVPYLAGSPSHEVLAAVFGGVVSGALGIAFLVMYILLALPYLIGGVGLLRDKRWGRIVSLVTSVLLVLTFPYFTLLGHFGLVIVLLDYRALLDTPAVQAPILGQGAEADAT